MRIPAPAAFLVCTLIWGGSWLAIRAAVDGADPVGIAALRTLAAFLILLPLAILAKIPRPGWAAIGVALAVGSIFIGANFALVFWSAPRLPVGFAAIAYSTTPLQAAFLAPLVRVNDRLSWSRLVGACLGAAGVFIAFGGLTNSQRVQLVPTITVLLGAFTSALGTVLARKWSRLHPLWMNVYANLAGFVVLIAYYGTDPSRPMLPQSRAAWTGFAYLVLAGSVVAMLLYFHLVRSWDATRATFTTLTTPFVALLLGFLLAGEAIRWQECVGAITVFAAGALALRTTKRAAQAAPAMNAAPQPASR